MLNRWRVVLQPATQGALYYFCFYGAAAVYRPFLSVFLAQRGFSGQEIGFLSAIGPLMAVLIGPLILACVDRRGGRVRMLGLGLLGIAVALSLLALPLSFVGLLGIITVLGLVSSFAGPLSDNLLDHLAEKHGLDSARCVFGARSVGLLSL